MADLDSLAKKSKAALTMLKGSMLVDLAQPIADYQDALENEIERLRNKNVNTQVHLMVIEDKIDKVLRGFGIDPEMIEREAKTKP